MSADDTEAKGDELQFDRVETGTAPSDAGAANPAVTCAVCRKPIDTEYYHINDKPVCEGCRHAVASAAATPRGSGPLVRAGVFGLAAAIAGAAIYYAVIAIANLEIGIIAILIGYMVGYAVRKGAAGRGGRRFQILAAVLTYWSVGLAYAPLAVSGVPSLPALATLAVYVFALPVSAIFRSMPGGLITALIIFIGLRQAWQMTAAPTFDVSGPYKVGARATLPPPATI